MKKIIIFIERVFLKLLPKCFLSDKTFIKIKYHIMTGLKLNLKNPVLYNEKVQWLKLNDRKPEYSIMSDKYEVRKYVSGIIGDEYLIPLYGAWESFDEIPFDTLPDQFVLKCTHDSGGIIICKDKKNLNIKKIRKSFNKRLSKNYFWHAREWAYKDIKPRIIAEKLMLDDSSEGINDYKIFCFNGQPKIIEVDIGRFTSHKRNFYSPQWEFQQLINERPNAPLDSVKKPETLNLMLELAKKLSFNLIHLRVDLYTINNKIYFGELTFYDGNGFNSYEPPEWNKTFGDWIKLPCFSSQ